ncbi:hypothetical protein JCM3774_006737 [Rhodotorula dairenensis]
MAGDDEPPTFPSDEAAIAHYRSRCTTLQAQLAAAEQDILEFTESSKELQAELESELERMDKAEKGMRRELDETRNDKEEWKSKYTTALRDHTATITHMQRELETLRDTEKSLRTRIRDMELDNDDLEKSEREKDSSLQNLETRYNKALERIALLEEELVAKAQLEEQVQRLKDELRDVNEELVATRAQAEVAVAAAAVPAAKSQTTPASPPRAEAAAPTEARAGTSSPPRSPASPASPPSAAVDPTPLPVRTRRASLIPSPPTSISPSKIARPPASAHPFPSPPPPTGQTPFRAPLGRSTRTAHLQSYGLPSSPSSPALASPTSRPRLVSAARLGSSSGGGTIPRTDTATMIRDMQQMTSRVRMLTQRLDQRRSSVMRGSAIPRFGSPSTANLAGLAHGDRSESPTTNGTMARSTTLRSFGAEADATSLPPRPSSRVGAPRPPSRLSERDSTRPPSRSAVLRASIASSMAASAHARSAASAGSTAAASASSRPSSRMSSTSGHSMTTRPLTPAGGPRSVTPTNGFHSSTTATSRAGSGLSSSSMAPPPRPGSSLGNRAGLSRSVAGSTPSHTRHGSNILASSTKPRLRSGRATPGGGDDDAADDLRSTVRVPSLAMSTGATRRASGIGLGNSGNALGKSLAGRRASMAGVYGREAHAESRRANEEVPPVPPLPTGAR